MIRGIAISNIGARYSHVLVGGTLNFNGNLRKWVPETGDAFAALVPPFSFWGREHERA
jgi:hypothetical protein